MCNLLIEINHCFFNKFIFFIFFQLFHFWMNKDNYMALFIFYYLQGGLSTNNLFIILIFLFLSIFVYQQFKKRL
jgi:hypothetical protein